MEINTGLSTHAWAYAIDDLRISRADQKAAEATREGRIACRQQQKDALDILNDSASFYGPGLDISTEINMPEEIDYTSFFKNNILLFKLLGFWKLQKGAKYQIIYNCYTAVCIMTWIAFLMSQFKYALEKLSDIMELTSILYVVGTFTLSLIRVLILYSKMDEIIRLIRGLNQPLFQTKTKEHYKLVMKMQNFANRIFLLCLYMGMQTYVFFSVIPFLRRERTNMTAGWFPFDCTIFPYYEAVYVFQNIVSLWNTIAALNMDTFSATLLIQIGIQCDLLTYTLNSLENFIVVDGQLFKTVGIYDDECDEKFSEEMTRNLIICINHHKVIKRLSQNIEHIHRISAFTIFIGDAVTICSGLFQVTVVKIGSFEFIFLLTYLICMVMEQLLYCWFGNEIIFKSEDIFRAAYNIPWYRCDIKFQKMLLMFMMQTKNNIKIKVGSVFVLSMNLFTSVFRSSYSYYTVLKQIQKSKGM